MTEPSSNGDGARLVACRSCGNRVARSARRCPACGVHEPTSAAPETPPPSDAPALPPRSRPRQFLGLALAAVVGAAAAGAVVLVMRPAPPPPPVERRPEAPAAAPEPGRETSPAVPPPPLPSRSRGRTDWLFFFKPGDQLARMIDDTPFGMVIRAEKTHTFSDGTTGPAYLLQVPEGGQRFVDADEVERSARIQ